MQDSTPEDDPVYVFRQKSLAILNDHLQKAAAETLELEKSMWRRMTPDQQTKLIQAKHQK